MGVILGGGAGEVQPVLAGVKLLTGGCSFSCTRELHFYSEEGTSFLISHGKALQAGW